MINSKKTTKTLIWRYIKYNIVGTFVFGVASLIYVLLFPSFGEWTYLLASFSGGILEFSIITVLNVTKKGKIFESCKPI